MHILAMHQDDHEYVTKLLFEIDPDSPGAHLLQTPPIFAAANIGDPKLFETLIYHSKVPPSTILKEKHVLEFNSPDGIIISHTDTPLSLILSKPQNYSLIDTLVALDKSDTCKLLTFIDLSHTRTCSLPVELFKLCNLYRINISHNKLSTLSLLKLPQNCWPNLLKDLNISYNSLEQIPSELFHLPCLEVLNVSHNSLKTLPERWWSTKSISVLVISFNADLTSLSLQDHGDDALPSPTTPISSLFKSFPVPGKVSQKLSNYSIACRGNVSLLKSLDASHCNINKFPSFLALCFPNLEMLNLSHNKLTQCSAINELPVSLEYLDVSNNLLDSYLAKYKVFHIDSDLIKTSTQMTHKYLSSLHTLKLANNTNLKTVCLSEDEMEHSSCNNFFPNLLKLDLSNCDLKHAIHSLEQLQKLTDLDISNNKDLHIPDEIVSLECLTTFNYDGIKDPIVNELELFTLTRDIQLYLHERKFVLVYVDIDIYICYRTWENQSYVLINWIPLFVCA